MTAKGSNTMVEAVTTNTAELDLSVTKAVTMCQDEHAAFLILSLANRSFFSALSAGSVAGLSCQYEDCFFYGDTSH